MMAETNRLSPEATYMGSLSAPFKAFMEATSHLEYAEKRWAGKIAAGFTNGAHSAARGDAARWRTASGITATPPSPNPFARLIPGIPSIRGSAARQLQKKGMPNQNLKSQFPTHPNREFFAALQGIKSSDQGNF
jgi:hypothetical protein